MSGQEVPRPRIRHIGGFYETLAGVLHEVRLCSPDVVTLQSRDESVRIQSLGGSEAGLYRWYSEAQERWVYSAQADILSPRNTGGFTGPYRVVQHA